MSDSKTVVNSGNAQINWGAINMLGSGTAASDKRGAAVGLALEVIKQAAPGMSYNEFDLTMDNLGKYADKIEKAMETV